MNRFDLVFGRARLRMATGDHVEVVREASRVGGRRCYSKRFMATEQGDFRHWTEREGRILTRLATLGVGPVPRVVQFDGAADDRPALVRTLDAGVTIEHWITLLPVRRGGVQHRHVFEDCAHWWALAYQCLVALDSLHERGVVHLNVKADKVCLPIDPEDFSPDACAEAGGAMVKPRFEPLALIDFAMALVPGERLDPPLLPLTTEGSLDDRSPRLLDAIEAGRHGDLGPTERLDWRCDVFSLAVMLRRCLPSEGDQGGWSPWHRAQAHALIRRLFEAHDAEASGPRPHRALMALANEALADAAVAVSLGRGWALVGDGDPDGDGIASPPALSSAGASGRPAAQAPRWIAIAAIAVPVLAALWWVMWPRPTVDHVAVLASPVPGAPLAPTGATPPLPATQPASGQAPEAPEPTPTAALEAATAAPAPLPTATQAHAVAPRAKPAPRKYKAALPSAGKASAGPPSVDEAERERVLEWLTRRGPSPRADMTLPPAPAAAAASAAEPRSP